MTDIALYVGGQMVRRLECGTAADIVVTIIATTCSGSIVHPGAANKGRGGMAEVTVCGGVDVLIMLTDGCPAIMAGLTVVYDTRVVECGGYECGGVVADAAILIGREMILRFAGRKPGVVA